MLQKNLINQKIINKKKFLFSFRNIKMNTPKSVNFISKIIKKLNLY